MTEDMTQFCRYQLRTTITSDGGVNFCNTFKLFCNFWLNSYWQLNDKSLCLYKLFCLPHCLTDIGALSVHILELAVGREIRCYGGHTGCG